MVKHSRQELHETADLMHSAALHLLREVRKVDAGMSLDGPRASLLSVLVFGGPRSVSALAESEQVSPPAITKLVTALEGDGLVERGQSSTDRRVVIVSATVAGRRLLQRGRAARVKAVERLLATLDAAELRTVREAASLVDRSLASG